MIDPMPRKVCLCGSSRFKANHEAAMRAETLAGRIVIPMGLYGHLEGMDMDGMTKSMLDELHLRKIDLADEVLVVNPRVLVCGKCNKPARLFNDFGQTECCNVRDSEIKPYIGQSTRREIEYAQLTGKPVRFLVGMEDQ